MCVSKRWIHGAARAAAFACALSVGACNSSDNEGGGGGGGGPSSPPSILAQPPGGTYPEDQLVTLSSNEPATVYYTTDGSIPAIGGPTTQSGPAPITGIPIQGGAGLEITRLLRYFGVGLTGIAGPLLAQEYTIDRIVPVVIPLGGDPEPIGILDQAVLVWQATDDGVFRVVLGGDGTSESGLLIEQGSYSEPRLIVQTEVPGLLLVPQPGEQSVHVFVTDAAGNQGSATFRVRLRGLAHVDVPGAIEDMALVLDQSEPTAKRLFVASAAAEGILAIHTPSAEVIGKILLGARADALAALPDGSRLYASTPDGIAVIDPQALTLEALIPLPGGAAPSGVAATPDGQRVYFGSSNGTLLYLDVASETILPTGIVDFPIETARVAIRQHLATAHGAAAWKGASSYGVFVFDSPTGTLTGSAIPPFAASPPGRIAVASTPGFERGFAGAFLNNVARFDLSMPGVEQFLFGSSLWGLALLPGDDILLLTHEDDLELEFLRTADLSTFATYDLAAFAHSSSSAGLGLPIAIERISEAGRDVTRAWLVQERGELGARLVRLPLRVSPL